MITEGIILLVYGLILHLPPSPWLGDVGFCFVSGIGILSTIKNNKKLL